MICSDDNIHDALEKVASSTYMQDLLREYKSSNKAGKRKEIASKAMLFGGVPVASILAAGKFGRKGIYAAGGSALAAAVGLRASSAKDKIKARKAMNKYISNTDGHGDPMYEKILTPSQLKYSRLQK